MGDGDDRIGTAQLGDIVHDFGFDLGVESACHLVKNENPRFCDERAGKRDTLALAAREFASHFADVGIEAVRQLGDEIAGTCLY